MAKCNICEIANGNVESKKVYEDAHLVAILHPKPATPGHIILIPKHHYPILENLSNDLIGHMFNTASKISSSIFESMNIHGTNIFVQNGVPAGQTIPHIMVHIIPRNENDNINLMWQPKKLDQEELSTVELKIKEETKNIVIQKEKEKQQPVEERKLEQLGTDGEEENYLLKQLRRIP